MCKNGVRGRRTPRGSPPAAPGEQAGDDREAADGAVRRGLRARPPRVLPAGAVRVQAGRRRRPQAMHQEAGQSARTRGLQGSHHRQVGVPLTTGRARRILEPIELFLVPAIDTGTQYLQLCT